MKQKDSSTSITRAACDEAISREQEKAINLLALGKNVKEVAREAGVSRATVYRWMKSDPPFVAAWNAWRNEQSQLARSRLLSFTTDAVDAVRDAVVKGDGHLALALLKGMGLLTPEAVGSDDAGVVARELEVAKWKERVALAERERKLGLDEGGM